MEINNTATGQGIFQDIDFLCHTNSSSYTIADKTRSVNNWQDFLVEEAIDAMDDWDFQGEIATAALSANQQEYIFPNDILKIKRIEVDYDGDGEYKTVDPSDINVYPELTLGSSASINAAFKQSAPRYFAFDNSFFLGPVPDTDRASGIKIWYTKDVRQITAMSTTWGAGTANSALIGNSGTPDFPRPFHKVLSLGASIDYGQRNRLDELVKYAERELYGQTQTRKGRVGGYITKWRDFFSSRNADKQLSLRTRYYKEPYG